MHKRQRICPDGQLVHERIRDIIGSVKSNHSREKSPGAEGSGRERAHGTRWRGVDASGIDGGGVGLDTVSDGDEGDLFIRRKGALEEGLGKGGRAVMSEVNTDNEEP